MTTHRNPADTHVGHSPAALRTALIVVDVQNDFCEGGALAVAGGAAAASACRALVTANRTPHGGPAYAATAATRDHHIDPGTHFAPEGTEPDFVTTWPVHCRAGTPGADFHPNLGEPLFDEIFRKGQYDDGYSGFGGIPAGGEQDAAGTGHARASSGLAEWLRGRGIEAVDIAGIATDHCVRATALDAAAEGFRTRVLLDCTAAVAPETTERALEQMRAAGIELVGSVPG